MIINWLESAYISRKILDQRGLRPILFHLGRSKVCQMPKLESDPRILQGCQVGREEEGGPVSIFPSLDEPLIGLALITLNSQKTSHSISRSMYSLPEAFLYSLLKVTHASPSPHVSSPMPSAPPPPFLSGSRRQSVMSLGRLLRPPHL